MKAVTANINLQALKHNLERVKELAPNSKVISVIKADAYGHGVLPVANALSASDCFAVARLDEACYLREQGIKKKIFLLEGVYSIKEYRLCMESQFIPAIHSIEQFHCLQEFAAKDLVFLSQYDNELQFKYWLKLDTGMHRLGLSGDELTYILENESDFFNEVNSRCLLTGIMSHFSCADEMDNPENDSQRLQFNQQYSQLLAIPTIENKAITKSMANSAAILTIPDAHFDWLRPGIMLYGISPFESSMPMRTGIDEQLMPVMTLSSCLIAIKKLNKGDCVGYGATWCCPQDMTIGVIAIGYGDGYPRHASAGTPVVIHHTEVPLVGRVSMDMITVDLTPVIEKSIPLKVGDRAILWGDGLPVERVSQKSDTIAYELLCQLTQRVHFEYE
ncbi:MAG: alanine racemase [gamma proteobacterium symbiont of Bathyaustriella thionipta]|nr:alanine racemase [gamma proteobacterium symbiont of Bathyaustriella thionipta]MCU7950431.1 alanine racemase [gamma proteobacterium symbiont of Bathyaustriella thionipta]MCU7953421.1 alanine racemase [gamma proteobacterium symbiont of Bathyaustriella thionipta]MCU7956937.1 alanine racemase [gamma proteobacterium symbiont of Bathyaustriella thionipta]MCU7966975.1 alanine racemase [gamma proteobacterium symbiont of Bathyaustriella thionipta]